MEMFVENLIWIVCVLFFVIMLLSWFVAKRNVQRMLNKREITAENVETKIKQYQHKRNILSCLFIAFTVVRMLLDYFVSEIVGNLFFTILFVFAWFMPRYASFVYYIEKTKTQKA